MFSSNKVVICQGENIIKRTKRALEILKPKLPKIGSKILIKPNLVEPKKKESGAITRPETIEGIIQYFSNQNYQIFIGESSAGWNTQQAFKLGGYLELEQKYKIKLIDFDKEKFVKIKLNSPFWDFVEISKIALETDYLISVAPLKQHVYVVTLTSKNMMGVIKSQRKYPTKQYMHKESNREIWAERLCLLLKKIKPHLAIIDGTTAMYGSHLDGKLQKKNLTIIGEDPVAVDIVGAEILSCKKVFYLEKMIKKKIGNYPKKIYED